LGNSKFGVFKKHMQANIRRVSGNTMPSSWKVTGHFVRVSKDGFNSQSLKRYQ